MGCDAMWSEYRRRHEFLSWENYYTLGVTNEAFAEEAL